MIVSHDLGLTDSTEYLYKFGGLVSNTLVLTSLLPVGSDTAKMVHACRSFGRIYKPLTLPPNTHTHSYAQGRDYGTILCCYSRFL